VAVKSRSRVRNRAEFLAAFILLKVLGYLSRSNAIRLCQLIARLGYRLNRRLRKTGQRNLSMALPELAPESREGILRGVVESLGRLLGEFSQFPKLDAESIKRIVVYEGLDHYLEAASQGKGVLLLTGHFGSWELCAFAHGLYGHPISFLVRPLDNPLLNELINRYRGLSGNKVIDKNRAVRPVLSTLRQGHDVGMLIDGNTVSEEGVFCDFFGVSACSTTGLAVFALRSGAPVVPGFLIWDASAGIHRLIFEPAIPMIRTGDFREEIRLNTASFTKVIERYAREYPEQWLWIHKRWSTRPAGEPDLYADDVEQGDFGSASRNATA
jgi:KDO2-lipid IV(A) lauroyltransferase